MLSPEQLIRTALDHHRANRFAEAEAAYRQALAHPWSPLHMTAAQNLAIILSTSNRGDEAIALLERAVASGPAPASLHYTLANALRTANRLDEAIAAYRRAADLAPNDADVHNNLGLSLKAVGESSAAIAAFRRALIANPKSFAAMINLGALLGEQHQLAESTAILQRAIELAPTMTQAHHNLALTLHAARQFRAALAAADRAKSLNPQYAPSFTAAANAHHDLGELAEALADYRRALELNFGDTVTHSNLLLAMSALEAEPAAALAEAKHFGARFDSPAPRPIEIKDRRIRIAYLSPDFRDHSVAHFIEPLLKNHDRGAFEVICYSDTKPDAVTARLRVLAEKFRDTLGHTDARLAAMIAGDAPDILIDLAGHTSHNRLPLLARRLAPRQGSFLGYPATTGVAAIDFRITDAIADPPGTTESHFTERLIRLPRCAWCYTAPDVAPPVAAVPVDVTFGSFNHIKKISAHCVSIWSQVLRQSPASRMLIKSAALADAQTCQRITSAFAAHGITADRLILLSAAATTAEHLSLYSRVSVALDTFPYNGTTTTCEALWMGVPVVTLAGATHASRVGASLLTAAGLEEYVAKDDQDFAALAANLAADSQSLAELRRTLRDKMRNSALMNGAAYAREIESALRVLL